MKKRKLNIKLPVGWVNVTVGQISLKVHYGFTATATTEETAVKYLRITDIGETGVDWNKVPFCKIRKDVIEHFELNENDLVFARTGGTVGKSYLIKKDVPKNAVFASYLIRIISSKNINAKYLSYFFQSKDYWHHIEINKTGLKTNVNAQILSNIKFNLPPSNEQNRIVSRLDELFSEIERGKEQLKSVLNQVKVYREAVLQNAFLGRLSEKWRDKNSNLHSGTELLKAINKSREKQYEKELIKLKKAGNMIKPKIPRLIDVIPKEESKLFPILPKEWAWVRLGDICSEVERVSSSKRNFSKEFLYLDIGGIDNEKNKIASHKVYEWGNAPSRAQQIVKVGDILFSTVRTYMKNIALVDNPAYNHQIASTGFTVIRPETDYINSKYIFSYTLTNVFINPLNELQTGSSYPAVRDKDVFNQPIPICSTKEQEFIAEELEKRFSICKNLEQVIADSLIQSEQLKQSILQQAFQGKLVEQNPNDESANILLEKIKREREQYLKEESIRKKDFHYILNISDMAEQLKSILELVRKSKKPISPLTLWQASEHKGDIDAFYSKLKEHIENGEIVELPRKGKEVFLTAANIK
ncbi:MAG: restriction endonuclease subunit S [Chitinophagaceae bacterium]|nr:restriction endonuclease subunit S [Chitinophagaceae bacterium]